MPSSIAHMLVSKLSREGLLADPDPEIQKFADVLKRNRLFMELGSLGPDLPYYESMTKGLTNLLFDRSDKPMGIDQWSYQLHAKDPNVFPLKMIEITWKETALEKEDWEEVDFAKLAFVCGFLTHMAADQTIHPLVNLIAGPYYKRGKSREKHRDCEVYQDVFIFNELRSRIGAREFRHEAFNEWCDIMPGLNLSIASGSENTPVWFRYLVQKSFVEAHAVSPEEESIENWVDGMLFFLRGLNSLGPFVDAYNDLAENGEHSPKHKEYIRLKLHGAAPDLMKKHSSLVGKKTYRDFFDSAVELSKLYIKAAHRIFDSDVLDDGIREGFRSVVSGVDLSAPLEPVNVETVRKALEGRPRTKIRLKSGERETIP